MEQTNIFVTKITDLLNIAIEQSNKLFSGCKKINICFKNDWRYQSEDDKTEGKNVKRPDFENVCNDISIFLKSTGLEVSIVSEILSDNYTEEMKDLDSGGRPHIIECWKISITLD